MYNEEKKSCLLRKLFIIVALLFVPFFIVLNATDTSALSKDYSEFILRVKYGGGSDYVYTSSLGYNDMVTNVLYLDGVDPVVNDISVPSNSNYIVASGKFNLVAQCGTFIGALPYELVCPDNNSNSPSIGNISVNGTLATAVNKSVNVYLTDWSIVNSSGYTTQYRTFTYEYSFVLSSPIPSTINRLAFFIGYDGRLQGTNNQTFVYFMEFDSNNKMTIDFTNDKNTAILQQQVQQQQLMLDALNNMNTGSNTYYNNYYDSVDNIEGQTSSDVDNATNGVTTNLIGLITSFMNEISSFNATSCVIAMPFPSFMGGTTNVNVCQGKDVLGNFVTVMATGALIFFYVPFAWVLLNLIYKEIRSWTNG